MIVHISNCDSYVVLYGLIFPSDNTNFSGNSTLINMPTDFPGQL